MYIIYETKFEFGSSEIVLISNKTEQEKRTLTLQEPLSVSESR